MSDESIVSVCGISARTVVGERAVVVEDGGEVGGDEDGDEDEEEEEEEEEDEIDLERLREEGSKSRSSSEFPDPGERRRGVGSWARGWEGGSPEEGRVRAKRCIGEDFDRGIGSGEEDGMEIASDGEDGDGDGDGEGEDGGEGKDLEREREGGRRG